MTDRKDDAVKPSEWRITIPADDQISPGNRWFSAERHKNGKPVELFLGGHGARQPKAKRPPALIGGDTGFRSAR